MSGFGVFLMVVSSLVVIFVSLFPPWECVVARGQATAWSTDKNAQVTRAIVLSFLGNPPPLGEDTVGTFPSLPSGKVVSVNLSISHLLSYLGAAGGVFALGLALRLGAKGEKQ